MCITPTIIVALTCVDTSCIRALAVCFALAAFVFATFANNDPSTAQFGLELTRLLHMLFASESSVTKQTGYRRHSSSSAGPPRDQRQSFSCKSGEQSSENPETIQLEDHTYEYTMPDGSHVRKTEMKLSASGIAAKKVAPAVAEWLSSRRGG